MPEIEHLGLCKKLSLIFFFFYFTSTSVSQTYPDPKVDSLLKSGIKNIITNRYQKAESTFTFLLNKYPELPLGKIYLSAAKIIQAYDLAEKFDLNYITENLDDAVKQSKELIKTDGENIWYRYFLALSEGYYAYFEVLNKNWFSAFNSGLNSVSELKKCLRLDPKFYEAYIGLGTFNYWKSRKTEFISWLPIIKNEEKSGIELLQTAVDSSSYNKFLAINSLIWIYIDKHEPVKAVTLADSALNQFPGSRLFEWGLARAYEDIDRSKSIKIYFEILNSYKRDNCLNDYNIILIKHIIAQQYFKIGEDRNALKLCNDILSIKSIPNYIIKKLGNRLERVRRLRKEILKELNK